MKPRHDIQPQVPPKKRKIKGLTTNNKRKKTKKQNDADRMSDDLSGGDDFPASTFDFAFSEDCE